MIEERIKMIEKRVKKGGVRREEIREKMIKKDDRGKWKEEIEKRKGKNK